MSFPTPPFCLFLPLSPLSGAVFFIVGSSGLWTKWWICGKSDNEHSQTSLALPPVLHVADSFGWHWKLLDCPSHAVAGSLMKAHRGALDSGPLAATTAGVRLMKRGTATLLFYPRPWGPHSPVWIPLWLLTCSLTRARTPLKELTSSRQQQRFHFRWEQNKTKQNNPHSSKSGGQFWTSLYLNKACQFLLLIPEIMIGKQYWIIFFDIHLNRYSGSSSAFSPHFLKSLILLKSWFAFKSQQVTLEIASNLFNIQLFWKLRGNIVTGSWISWAIVRGHHFHTHMCFCFSQQLIESRFQSAQGRARNMNYLHSCLSFP